MSLRMARNISPRSSTSPTSCRPPTSRSGNGLPRIFSAVSSTICPPSSTGTGAKKRAKARLDTDLTASALEGVIRDYKKLVEKKTGAPFPQDTTKQLAMARDAVFRSWHNPRAVHYRRMNGIPETLGTAVNVQTMVFGNLGETSGTGVGFTRNPSTGAREFYGEFLMNAQGEDVVAGIRTPVPIEQLKAVMPGVYAELRKLTERLERHYKDMQDFEFTIQEGKLYMLQTRNGKRTGKAAVRVAVDIRS